MGLLDRVTEKERELIKHQIRNYSLSEGDYADMDISVHDSFVFSR